jgi:anti-anti-sigma factor
MDSGKVEHRRLDGAQVVALYGEHDLSTLPQVRRGLQAAFRGTSAILIDATRAEFIDSSIVNELVQAHREARQRDIRLGIIATPDSFVRRVLDLVGIPDVIPVYPTPGRALADLLANPDDQTSAAGGAA